MDESSQLLPLFGSDKRQRLRDAHRERRQPYLQINVAWIIGLVFDVVRFANGNRHISKRRLQLGRRQIRAILSDHLPLQRLITPYQSNSQTRNGSLIAPTSALLGLLFLTSPAKLPRADSALARWQSRYLRLAASSRIPGAQVDPK